MTGWLGLAMLGYFVMWQVYPSHGQFPRVCASNATREHARCCPIPPGFTEPCGGGDRGSCLPFHDIREDFWPPFTNEGQDDRINWPVAFFKFGCHCNGNFAGYMCQECKWGYRGHNCMERYIRKRKNIFSLSKREQQHFLDILDLAKHTPSEYVALANRQIDPVRQPKFVTLTVYDFITYIHFFSARSTYLGQHGNKLCEFNSDRLDYSHGGPGFPTFHRLLVLFWERELQKVANDDSFSVPYWDWVDGGTNCSICTNDLLGEILPNGYLHHESRFSTWQTLCNIATYGECRFCDPTVFTGYIERNLGGRPMATRLPTEAEVDFVLTLTQYDVPPFDESSAPAFRSCYEGHCPGPGQAVGVHGLVHSFFNGTLSSVPVAVNDPIFLLHHAFLDKILELWLRKFRPHSTQVPKRGAPMGHNRDAVMVPFYPRHFQSWYFTDSRGLGYDYDNFNYGKSGKVKFVESQNTAVRGPPPPPRSPLMMMTVTLGVPGIVFFCLAVLFIHGQWPKEHLDQQTVKYPDQQYSLVGKEETLKDGVYHD